MRLADVFEASLKVLRILLRISPEWLSFQANPVVVGVLSPVLKWSRTIEPARANFALGGFFFFSVRSLHATLVIGKDFRPYLLTN